MLWAESMDGQCLARHCLTLPLLFLGLGAMFSLITMLSLHVGFHGGHASRREAVGMTGQAHLIMFANMVIEGFVVRRPKQTHRAEVGIYPTTVQQHLCLAWVSLEWRSHRPIIPGCPKPSRSP